MAHSPGTAVMIGWKVSYLRKTDDGFGFAALGLQEDGGLDEFDVDCWARDGTSGFHAFRLGERAGQTEWTPVRRGTAVILRVELGAMRDPDQMVGLHQVVLGMGIPRVCFDCGATSPGPPRGMRLLVDGNKVQPRCAKHGSLSMAAVGSTLNLQVRSVALTRYEPLP